MTYRIRQEWGADRNWKQQRVGYQLEMHADADPDAPAALREVAQWALADGTDVCVAMDEQTGRVQPAKGPDGWTVELTAHVLHCGDVRRPVDGGERRFVREVKQRLASLGMTEK
jgi:hypothetical protein